MLPGKGFTAQSVGVLARSKRHESASTSEETVIRSDGLMF